MSSKWIVPVCLVISLLNSGVLIYQYVNPAINVKGMTAKSWLTDKQFKKAVENIAADEVSSKGFLDEDEVKELVEKLGYLDEDEVRELVRKCVATRGRIEC
ncbi:hypothetical protein [Bradyrhizobium sp. Arg816]|uniref:hypothetical protein n=1 Tax=Bradyrhizobium sp. Arg816 TaxID=2998491 RepID=UPI00249DD6CD|nr:hypothetical protein [Bradyrhizobium sp. Arg816]MDI3562540.1 hypothetical protein [Bradyrhizobium sp. Arg816]